MKKSLLAVYIMAAAIGTVSITSCSEGKDKEAPKSSTPTKKSGTPSKESDGLKIAFIDMDSVSNNYDYQKDIKAKLEASQKQAESTLNAKEQSLKARYEAFQKKALAFQQKASKVRSEAEQAALEPEANALKNEEAAIAKLEQDYQKEQAKLSQDFQEQFSNHTKAFNDTIENFLQEYGESNGYDLLLGKSASTGGVLYGKEAYDVTTEVIEALNERYKSYKK